MQIITATGIIFALFISMVVVFSHVLKTFRFFSLIMLPRYNLPHLNLASGENKKRNIVIMSHEKIMLDRMEREEVHLVDSVTK